jgi:hypothetical protein
MSKQTKETLNFNNNSGYYGSILSGYGGFTWSDVDFMNATYWQNVMTDWCDTGFQNVIHGAGEAFTWNNNGSTSYAVFSTVNLNETFSLKSMVAASGWETAQPFDFLSYTYQTGHGFIAKASDIVYLSQTAQTINFAKIGKPGDFKNIALVEIISGSGKYGNTCSYGRYGYTLGNEMAFDNLKVKWNGKIPTGNGKVVTTGLSPHNHLRGSHGVSAHLVSGDSHQGANVAAHADATTHSAMQAGFHTELMSLGETQSGDLTGQFHLPAVEHFGT